MNTNSVQQKKAGQTNSTAGSSVTYIDIGGRPAPPQVRRFLSVYTKEGEYPIAEYPLLIIDVAALQDLFEQPRDNPMYDVYPVSEAQAERLRAHVDQPIDLRAYDYFVECYAE